MMTGDSKTWPPTLAAHVQQRNGVPLGAPGSLRKMLIRSLGAPSFGSFWQHWNPVWGYALSRFIHAPLRRAVPSSIASFATFVVSGATHDLAVTLVRRSPTFVVTPWFILLGIGMLAGRWAGMDLSGRSWAFRAVANLGYLGACLVLSQLLVSA